LNMFRELVLKISFSWLCYLFQVAFIATLILIIVQSSVWSTATASIIAVPFATDVVELRSTITADFLLARKASRGRSVRSYIM
jgi:predicted small integral membrane protein